MMMVVGHCDDRRKGDSPRDCLYILAEVITVKLNLGSVGLKVRAGGSEATPLTGVEFSSPKIPRCGVNKSHDSIYLA